MMATGAVERPLTTESWEATSSLTHAGVTGSGSGCTQAQTEWTRDEGEREGDAVPGKRDTRREKEREREIAREWGS